MRNRIRTRQVILFVVLAASIGASIWARYQEGAERETVVTPMERGRVASVREAPIGNQRLALERLNHRRPGASDVDPFRAKIWFVPPPVAAPAPPPKPTAPQLPFQYAGKSEDADGRGNVMVYLSKGNESFAVKPGEKFDGVYQFEGVENGNVVIVYLPLSVKQRLAIGQAE